MISENTNKSLKQQQAMIKYLSATTKHMYYWKI